MSDLREICSGATRHVSAVAAVADARRRRDRIAEITDWAISNIPWTVSITDWPGFHDRWPLLSRADLFAVEEQLSLRRRAFEARHADLDAIAAKLTGRPGYYTAAADWLTLNSNAEITSAHFMWLFGQLSRAELMLAVIAHKRGVRKSRLAV